MVTKQAAVVAATLILVLAGCSTSSADWANNSHVGDGSTAGAESTGQEDLRASPVAKVKLPDDFPADVPLPSSPPGTVSAGRVPGGKRLWSLSYDDVSQVRSEEREALKSAGFVATLESDDGTGSYTKDATSVVTVVRGGHFVIMVTTQY